MSATDTSKKPRKSVAWAEPLETIIPFEREEWEWEQSFGRDKSSCGIRSVRRLRRFELDFEEETASDEENEEPTSELHAAYSSRYSRKAVSFEDFEDPMDFFNAMLGHEALYEPAASANQLRKEFAKKTISPAPIHAESAFDGPCTVSLPADSDQTARALTLTDSDGANESGSIGDSEPHPQEDVSLGTLQDEQNGSAALAAHESCRLDVGAEIGVNPEPILGVRVEIHLSEELEDALAHFPRASCEGRLIDIDILEAISDMLYSVPLVQETERIAVEGTCQLCLAQEIERAVVEETCEVCLAQEVAEPTAPAAEEVREMCPVKQLESSSLSTPASPPMPLALGVHSSSFGLMIVLLFHILFMIFSAWISSSVRPLRHPPIRDQLFAYFSQRAPSFQPVSEALQDKAFSYTNDLVLSLRPLFRRTSRYVASEWSPV